MLRQWRHQVFFVLSLLLICSDGWGASAGVHYFDCKECHLSGKTINELGGSNVCLKCHDLAAGDITLNSGVNGHTDGRFSSGDASNAFGHGTGSPSAYQTSHNWAVSSDTLAAAGAQAPLRSEHPEFYSRYGTSTGKLTCCRCHNPHGSSATNPQLLVKGDNSADEMCLACHSPWDQTDNHGWLTHPIIDDYTASVATAPDKYKNNLSNKGNASIKLVNGGVSCTSCHGVHFVDSDSSTLDGPLESLSMSDGKLLLSDGPLRSDKSSLCQTCHTYLEHGNNSGEKVGCLVCHSGHSYDPDSPNYFVLRKSATTVRFSTVNDLDYSSPDIVNPAKADSKYTFWQDQSDGTDNGYCERCHGDASALPGSIHTSDAKCTSCHTHNPEGSGSFGHGGGGTGCQDCHGHDAGTPIDPDLSAPYTAGATASQGKGSFQSHSTHTETDADDAKGPGIYCDGCHDITNFPSFKKGAGTDINGDGRLSLDETNVCDPCHSPDGTFEGINDEEIGAKKAWRTGAYTSTDSSTLITNKEKWCVGCHDSGTSNIGGRQAPDVAGDNSSYGYYLSGHGAFTIECDGCHDANIAHIDGVKTYQALSPTNYKEGYRLSDVDGNDPMTPATKDGSGCDYNAGRYRLCFSCHSEKSLIQEASLTSGTCTDENPFKNNPATTGFRNLRDSGGTPYSTNLHWRHLTSLNFTGTWDSDSDGDMESATGCITCHNPHSESRADSTPTIRMTKSGMEISSGSDANGSYGEFLNPSFPCAACHGSPGKYYRTAPEDSTLSPPNTPINSTPVPGAFDLLQPQTLEASAFDDPDSDDTHNYSQWLISSASGSYVNHLVYDSGYITGSATHTPPISWSSGATYFWKVRYRDNRGLWSDFSEETSFTILANAVPAQPTHVSPEQSEMNVDRRQTLVASPFYDDDTGDSHAGVEWQLNGTPDFSGSLIHTSGDIMPTTSAVDPRTISYVVPLRLEANHLYYWRVRYKDSKGQWSKFSDVASFTTNSLISKFEFEDNPADNTAADSEEDNDGTLVGGATWTTGFLGQGLYFDGTSGEMTWSYANEFPQDTFTMEAMVKATTTHQIDTEAVSGTDGQSGQKYLFEATSVGGSQAGAGISVGTNGISVYERSGNYMPPVAVYDPAAKIPAQAQLGTDWNHVVVTYTGTQPRIYLNGRLVHTGLNSSMGDVFAPIQMGHGWYGGFTGTVDEVAIYNKALTPTEILQRCLDLGQCTPADIDNDGVTDSADNCPLEYNPDQADLYGNGIGNVCDYLGFWKLNEANGRITADESGRRHATIGSYEQWTSGVAGGSAFSGNGSFNSVEINNLLDNYNGDFSLSVWLKFPAGTTNPKWSLIKDDPYNNIGFGIAHWNDTDPDIPPGLFLNDGTPGDAHRVSLYASSIPRETWGHFIWTVDRANQVMKVYKNGQPEGEIDISILGANAITSDGVFDFATPSNMFTGALDNVGVYDFVLQPGDVLARYEADLRDQSESSVQYSVSLADNDSSDPVAAEAGYTNNRSVTVNVTYSGTVPTEMEFAEDLAFTANASGWIPFNTNHTYLLSAGDGTREVYCRLKSATGPLALLRTTIILDTAEPVVNNTALVSPNDGSEVWVQGATENITWTPGDVSDDHLKDSPVSLAYSTDSGISFPNQIVADEINDGDYVWFVPVVESLTARVQLLVTDRAGNQGADISDIDFIITPVTPVLDSIALTDNNDADPAKAEDGYTNSQDVEVTLSVSNYPTQMILAEDAGFSVNATGWVAYSPSYTYTLTPGDGPKTVYAKIRNNAPGESATRSDIIILDEQYPTISSGTLTSPNGHDTNRWQADFFTRGTEQVITWNSADIGDLNLKANPVFLRASVDSGGSWSATVAGDEVTNVGEANDGTYLWNVDADFTHYAKIQLAARDKAGNEATDISDNDFNISPLPGYIVTNTNDSGTGSLRQVLSDLSGAGGNSPVWFNIPDTDPDIINGVAIISTASSYANILGGTLLDGTSQTVLRGDTNTNGPEVRVHYTGAANINGLAITGNSSGVRDLQITEFYTGIHVSGANASIEGSQFGFFSDSTGYGASPNSIDIRFQNGSVATVTDNDLCSRSGVSLSGAADVRLESNTIGLFPDGSVCSTEFGINMSNSTDVNILDNIIISSSRGISTSGYNNNTSGLIIQGNQIGAVYREGSWIDLPGPTTGIYIESKSGGNHLIGGGTIASSDDLLNQSNVVSADNIGIDIVDVLDNSTEVHGNFIGTNFGQNEVFTGNVGILIGCPITYGLRGVTVGGVGTDSNGDEIDTGNVIANMSQYGISLRQCYTGSSREHVFSRNAFYNNGNDSGDDAIYLNPSGNGSIARPVANLTPDNKLVVNDVYGGYSETTGDIIEVYIADFGGTEYGEGKEFIVSAQASGAPTSITIDLSQLITDGVIQQGDWLTVTKTNIFNGTSAFSANVKLTGPTVPTLDWTGESNYTTDGVDPDSGAQLSDFTFRVEYTDNDNDSPWPIEVWVDVDDNGSYEADEIFAMTAVGGGDSDYTNGELYTYSLSLPYAGDGIRKYRFYASDANLTATGLPTADKTFEVINDSPVTPSNVTPGAGVTGVMQPPILFASAYANTAVDELAGDYHQASQWLISSVSGDFSAPNLLYNSGTFIASDNHDASFAWAPNTTYHWKVRYQDNHGAWSAYSTDTSFTTFNNTMPDQPTNVTPASGAVNVPLLPTLTASSPYSDPDGDAHQASAWQISLAGGARFDTAIVYNSVTGPVTSHSVTSSLTENNRYFWRVRYQDNAGQWSAWSTPTDFFAPTSLLSLFTFDNDSGTIAEDVYGVYNGAVLNGAVWSNGFSGQGLTLDGIDDQVSLSYAGGTPPANNFTLEAMVKATGTHQIDIESTTGAVGTTGQNYLFGADWVEAPDAGAGVSMGTNGVSVYEHSGSYMPAVAVYDPAGKNPVQPQLGTGWNHVVISYTDKQSRIYLNGQLVHTGLTSPRTDVLAPTKLGNMSYGAFAGIVDEVSIYNSALTDTEVMQHCIAVGQCDSADLDGDGVTDSSDNCMFDANPDQNDQDNDGIGNACDPLGFWEFDEGSGTNAQDSTNNGNDGTLVGGATWTVGKVGNAVDLDGATGNISIPDTPDHHFGTGSFTIETWINASSFTSTEDPNLVRWFSKNNWCSDWKTAPDPSCVWFVGQITSAGQPQFSGRGYNDSDYFGATAPALLSLNTWHHIAYVIDRDSTPAKGFIYIDGVNQSGTGVEFPQLTGVVDIPASIGLGGLYAKLTGKLDKTAIYDSALTEAEIFDHYQNP